MGVVVVKTKEVVVGEDLVAGVDHMVVEEAVQDMGKVQGYQVVEEQIIIVDLGDKKGFGNKWWNKRIW
jgi:hypothetical protein